MPLLSPDVIREIGELIETTSCLAAGQDFRESTTTDVPFKKRSNRIFVQEVELEIVGVLRSGTPISWEREETEGSRCVIGLQDLVLDDTHIVSKLGLGASKFN